MLDNLLKQYKDKKIAVYGLGTETERFLQKYATETSVVCLLDGFRECGELYGVPIWSLQQAVEMQISLIIVVARPGSCKAIRKYIGEICRKNGILLYDVRGCDLLAEVVTRFDFQTVAGESQNALMDKINCAEIVSFDLFDTLITRKIYSYTDIFDLIEFEINNRGVFCPNFKELRLSAEKELSKTTAPTLEQIYSELLKNADCEYLCKEELAQIEWKIDFSLLLKRESMCKLYEELLSAGKKVVVITDSYYKKEQIEQIFSKLNISKCNNIFISCEYGVSKKLGLYDLVLNVCNTYNILHIGDDEINDIEEASKKNMNTHRIYSGADLFDAIGGLGIEKAVNTFSDRVKCGLFISRIFNSPFQFEQKNCRITIETAFDIGYLICGEMVLNFILWMKEYAEKKGISQILFCARDGYLIKDLYQKIDGQTNSVYFLTSRMAAMRAGVETNADIVYADSMKYSGTQKEALKARFGIELVECEKEERTKQILKKAQEQKRNYQNYIKGIQLNDERIVIFDFVAKGTVQMYLERIFEQKIKGLYFMQLEPGFMKDKGLDIEPYYLNEEGKSSAVFDNYYILETILTSPFPQLEEFDNKGEPVFARETRSKSDIQCFEAMQDGIKAFFNDYIEIVPKAKREQNKELGEILLALINKVEINDEDFLNLKVEDPFFGRMTDIKDIIV